MVREGLRPPYMGRLVGLDCSNHRPLKPPRLHMQLSATLISLVFYSFCLVSANYTWSSHLSSGQDKSIVWIACIIRQYHSLMLDPSCGIPSHKANQVRYSNSVALLYWLVHPSRTSTLRYFPFDLPCDSTTSEKARSYRVIAVELWSTNQYHHSKECVTFSENWTTRRRKRTRPTWLVDPRFAMGKIIWIPSLLPQVCMVVVVAEPNPSPRKGGAI